MKFRTLLTRQFWGGAWGHLSDKISPWRPQPSHLAGPGSPCFVLLTQISQLLAHVSSERSSVLWLQFLKNLGHFTGKFRIQSKTSPSFHFTSVLESCNCTFIGFVSFSYWCMDEHDRRLTGQWLHGCLSSWMVILTTPFPHQQTFVLGLQRLTLFLLQQLRSYSLSHCQIDSRLTEGNLGSEPHMTSLLIHTCARKPAQACQPSTLIPGLCLQTMIQAGSPLC